MTAIIPGILKQSFADKCGVVTVGGNQGFLFEPWIPEWLQGNAPDGGIDNAPVYSFDGPLYAYSDDINCLAFSMNNHVNGFYSPGDISIHRDELSPDNPDVINHRKINELRMQGVLDEHAYEQHLTHWLEKDGLTHVSPGESVPEGHYLTAMFMNKVFNRKKNQRILDFHVMTQFKNVGTFGRDDPKQKGWVHKPGSALPTARDISGKKIEDPRNVLFMNPAKFIGFFAVPKGGISVKGKNKFFIPGP